MFGRAKTAGPNAGVCVPSEASKSWGTASWVGFDRRSLVAGLLVFAGYLLGARVGFALTFQPHPVSVMWPPNSILLGALLLTPAKHWPFLILAALPAHLIIQLKSGVPFTMIACWFISNSSEALIGASATRWLVGPSARFNRLQNMALLFVCGALLAPFLSSFIDAAFVALNQFGDQSYWQVWKMRFCSNVFTSLILLPVIVSWGAQGFAPLREIPRRHLFEALVVFPGLLAVTIWVFCLQENGPTRIPLLLYAPLPFLLWAAVRFGPTGTSAGIAIVAFLAIWGAVHGNGPFASHSPEQNALSIQAFFIVVSVALMFLTTSIAERGKAEERFTKAFRSSPDAMAIIRLKDHHIIEINDRWEKIFGYRSSQTTGRTMSDLNIYTSEVDRERLIVGTSAGESLHDLEFCLRANTGELRNALISADREDIGGEDCLIVVIRDITDLKRAEEAQQNLTHASRLAVVGELTAMVAHEINQPLAAILCNAEAAEMLLDSKEVPIGEIRNILSDIRKNDLRADEAIRRIRSLLRKRAVQMQPLDLNDAISDVLRLVAGDALKRHVAIQRDLGQNLPLVSGDRVYLQQVLLNLIINGMDAMNDIPRSARRLIISTKQNGLFIQAGVRDSGVGIAPDKIGRVFESFFTTKNDGMGLGLSIARSIIETHRGRIWAEDNSGVGATFYFTVPLAGQNANA